MKKTVFYLLLIALITTACGQGGNKAQQTAAVSSDPNVVNVLYFHGKQRCSTCEAISKIAEKTVKTAYADNKDVRFILLDSSAEANRALTAKYEVTWNALIIAKGDNAVNLTQLAIATALSNPQSLENRIKTEIGKRL